MRQRVERAFAWILDNFDTALALGAALTFGVLDWLGVLKTEQLAAPTLAVLALLSFALIRLREANSKLLGSLQKISGDQPYAILRTHLTWDLVSPDGSKAFAIKRRRIKFLQEDVFAMHDHSSSSGSTVAYVSADPTRYEKVDEFLAGGRKIYLISLRGFWRAGQELDVETTRELKDCFGEKRENVTVEIEGTSDLTIEIVWPAGRDPNRVWIEKNGRVDVEIDPASLPTRDGRKHLSRHFDRPTVGSELTVAWEWPTGA